MEMVFQFTPLREGRLPNFFERRKSMENFNSRPSARGDVEPIEKELVGVFQFTPLREGRQPRTNPPP